MTKKFNELYENLQIGFPISVQNPSREVPETVGVDMGKELNDKELARVHDLTTNDGKLVNRYPTNLKVKYYMFQLQQLSPVELAQTAESIGFEHADQYKAEDVIEAIVNYLGPRPEAWKVLSPMIFTEGTLLPDDKLMDVAVDVYDAVAYKDLGNKNKIKSALKKLGHGTDPITVGRVMRKIKDNMDESVEESEDDSEWVSSKSHDTFYDTDFDDDDDDYDYSDYVGDGHEIPVHPHRHEIVSWDDNYDNMDERIIKKDVVRDGKKTKIMQSDRDDKKMIKGKEVRMSRNEKKSREESAVKREKNTPNIGQKRQPSFQKSMRVKREMKRKNERRRK